MDKGKKITQIVTISLIINIGLAIAKMLGGILGNALTLISDSLNSMADVFVSVMLLIVLKIANKKADKNHPYGHEKYEGIVDFILGIVVCGTAIFIGYSSILELYNWISYSPVDGPRVYEAPNAIAVIVAVVALVLKCFLVFINLRGSRKYDAPALRADSINHIGDVLATSTGLIGIVIAFLNPNLGFIDFVASLIIGLVILKAGIDIIKESVSYLVDEAPDIKELDEIKKTILGTQGVLGVDDLKARRHVTKLYVDVEILLDSNLTLLESHNIAENVHDIVEKTYPDIKHIMVHVNPNSKQN